LVACIWHFGNLKTYANLATIKDNQQFLLSHINSRPLLSGILYIVIFFILTVSALPVTIIMITIGGFLFGTALGSLYTLIALATSSICVFKLSRKMFGNYLQEKYSHELKKFNNNFKEYGFYYLIFVRTIPVIPFFIVNAAAGFTHISTQNFLLSTVFGAIPIILLFSYLGSQCSSLIVNC
jgi:uncharacterized membrane protein YdjX (TVP38/TMEM64 family)